MAQIFISYKSEEREAVAVIAGALQEEGFTVWWDHSLIGGQNYAEVIDTQIADAKVIIPIWSRQSVKSKWVGAEAERGGDKLFPVRIHDVEPPLPYNQLHTLDLTGWKGDRNDPRWRRIVADLAAITSGATAPLQSVEVTSANRGNGVGRRLMGWAAAMAALCVVGFAGFHFVAPRFNTPSDALAMNEISQTSTQGSAASNVGATSEPADPAETNGAPPPVRRGIVVRTYDEAVSALDAPGSRVALELCNGARCGLTRVRVGDVITVRVRSPTAGRLWLMDRNSEGDRQQIFPNGLSSAGAALRVEANETISLPTVDHQFAFQVSEPIGPSLLTAVVMNDSVEPPPVMQRNAQNTRGIGVVSRTELDGVATPVTQSLAEDGDEQAVSIGELEYIVTR